MISFLRYLLAGSRIAKSAFGSAGILRQRIAGAILIVGSWQAERGVEMDEAGISVSDFTVIYRPHVNERLMSNVGEPRARAISDKMSREVHIKGEVTDVTLGVMAYTLGTACAVANDVADFGDGSGTLLLDEATVTHARAGWVTVDIKLSSDPGVI
jgi:hypothetical protein